MAGASNARTNKKKSKPGRKVTHDTGHQDELDPDKPVLLADPSFEEWMMIILGVSEEMLSDNNTEYLLPWINVEDNTHEMPEDVFFTREALRLLYPRMPKIWKVTDKTLLKPGKKKEDASGGGHRKFGLREHGDTLVNPWIWYTREQNKIRTRIRGGSATDPSTPQPEHPYFHTDFIRKGKHSFLDMLAEQYNKNKEHIFMEYIKSSEFAENLDKDRMAFLRKAMEEFPKNQTFCELDKAFDRCVIHVDPERCNDPNYGYIEVNTVSKSGRVIGVTPINNPIPRAIWVNNTLDSFF